MSELSIGVIPSRPSASLRASSDGEESPSQVGGRSLASLGMTPAMTEDAALLVPIETTSRKFWFGVGTLFAIGLWGAFAWYTQLRRGLSVTGLNVPVYWGLY